MCVHLGFDRKAPCSPVDVSELTLRTHAPEESHAYGVAGECVHGKCLTLQEKQKLLDEIEELSLRLSDEQENRRKLGDRLSHERHQFQKDKEATQEVNTSPGLSLSEVPESIGPIWSELGAHCFQRGVGGAGRYWVHGGVWEAWHPPPPQKWHLDRCRGSETRGWVGCSLYGSTQLIEDLRKQLEHLQLFKLEAEQRRGRSNSVGLQEYNSRTRESELEQEVRRLKQVLLGRHPYTWKTLTGNLHWKRGLWRVTARE